jgi:type II secretory pathway pseudopilin PulG
MKLYSVKKRSMTLIELVISMGLIILLLTTLTYFYGQVGKLSIQAEAAQKGNFELRYLEGRLQKTLPNALGETDVSESPFTFFTSNDLGGLLAENTPSLVFIFQNGVSLNPQLANHVLARLYLDKQKRLCLAKWPSPDRWDQTKSLKAHQEILMENVESLSFSFYVVPERNRTIIEKTAKKSARPEALVEPENKGEWIHEWKKEYAHLPAMMKVLIKYLIPGKDEAEELVFAFVLPNSQKLVVYE